MIMHYLKPTINKARAVKKTWLAALIMQGLAAIAFTFLKLPAIPEAVTFPIVAMRIFAIIIGLGILDMLYRSAYKKNNSTWLLIILIFGPLSIIANAYKNIERAGLMLSALYIIIQTFFLLQSFRLYIINKQLQKQAK